MGQQEEPDMSPAQSDAMQAAIEALRHNLGKTELRDVLQAAVKMADAESILITTFSEGAWLRYEREVEEMNGALERYREQIAHEMAIYEAHVKEGA